MGIQTASDFKALASKVLAISSERDATVEERAEWGDASHWTVRLTYKGRRMTAAYSMGSAHTGRPEVADVLSCLISDGESVVSAGGNTTPETFAAWCGDLGYDADSRKAERIFKACASIGQRVRRLLGDDYAEFRDAAQDY